MGKGKKVGNKLSVDAGSAKSRNPKATGGGGGGAFNESQNIQTSKSSSNLTTGNISNATTTTDTATGVGAISDLSAKLSPQVLAEGAWKSLTNSSEQFQSGGGAAVYWIFSSIFLGCLLGYAIGAGWTDFSGTVSPWRKSMGKSIRSSSAFQLITLQSDKWEELLEDVSTKRDFFFRWTTGQRQKRTLTESRIFERNPSHPHTFALLREAIVREKGGYVHDDLGYLTPAPCGAFRGLGMVTDRYHACQTRCIPGTSEEKFEWMKKKQIQQACQSSNGDMECDERANEMPMSPLNGEQLYRQEEILLRIPLSYQMTRSVAIDTLSSLIPDEVQTKNNFHALDDAAMLVLLLAHERGLGRYSRWYPYILSLPIEPSCGYSRSLRPQILDALEAMRHELKIDVEGWSSELVKAAMYADRIEHGLNSDYGEYISSPKGISSLENIKWALCQVSSRATAGNEEYGALRMVPVLDLINHDVNAGGFIELNGTERIEKGDFVDAFVRSRNSTEDDRGTFIVRSMRHGQRRPLRKGQELMANYNVPLYTPLDWFLLLGFVPIERWAPWEKVDPVLPRVRRDGPFSEEVLSSKEQWEKDARTVLKRIREAEDILF